MLSKRTWALFAGLLIVGFPLLAFAQAVVPTVDAKAGILASLAAVLPVLASFGGPYLTHILQSYSQKISPQVQPLISIVAGILISVLTALVTGSPMTSETAGMIGGVAGLVGHGVIQSPPIPAPAPKG